MPYLLRNLSDLLQFWPSVIWIDYRSVSIAVCTQCLYNSMLSLAWVLSVWHQQVVFPSTPADSGIFCVSCIADIFNLCITQLSYCPVSSLSPLHQYIFYWQRSISADLGVLRINYESFKWDSTMDLRINQFSPFSECIVFQASCVVTSGGQTISWCAVVPN